MRKKLIARTAKLLSESKRNRRHQGVAVAYEHIPNDIDERKHGAIYAVVNVNASSDLGEEVGEVIVDTFHGEYYQDLNRDPVASFEAALARVNEELAEITHQGNTAWLGNLHAVLAVTSDDMIYLTRTGKAEGYLYRGGRAKHATDGIEGDNVNPLRTFAYTASTELLEGDKMVFATPGVFFHVSKDELQKYIEEFQPKVAISHLADLLEDNSGEVHPNAILIIEAITPEAASEETVPELNDEVWITDPVKPVQTAIDAGAPVVKKVFYYAKVGVGAVTSFLATKAWPTAKKWSHDIVDIVRNLIKKEKPVLVKTKESIVSEGGKESLEDLTIHDAANEFATAAPGDTRNALYIKETSHKPKLLNLDFSSATGIRGKLGKFLNRFTKNRQGVLYVAIGLVLLLAIGLFTYSRIRVGAEDQKLAEASYNEAVSKYDIGQTKLTSGDKQQAADSLRSAFDITETLKKNAKLKVQATDLGAKIRTALDTAEGIIRVGATSFGDASQIVGTDTFGPYLVGTNLYLIGKGDGSIASVSVTGGEVSRVLDKPKIEGKITSAAAVPVRSVLVFMTDAGKIYEFDTKDVKLNQQTVAGDFEKSISLASFSTNIYSLDSSGKIYKRLKNSSGYGARTEYITDGSVASDAVSVAIDSNVYAMKANGAIDKYLGGKKQTYNTAGLPITIGGASNVFANEETVGLYELEGSASRVVRFDTTGNFVSQLVSDNYKNASGLSVDDKSKVLYVVSDGKIYKATL